MRDAFYICMFILVISISTSACNIRDGLNEVAKAIRERGEK